MVLGLLLLLVISVPFFLPPWKDVFFEFGPCRIGFSREIIGDGSRPYLQRWIWWTVVGSLRLHKFYRGDDDRAAHNHPFFFITFPLKTYHEKVLDTKTGTLRVREVTSFRPHFRSANHTHIVMDQPNRSSFWTIVYCGPRQQSWGFFPWCPLLRKHKFVGWRDWV